MKIFIIHAISFFIPINELQLVTIIDSICADGTAEIGPRFVFPGTTKHREWFEETEMKIL